jgi:glycosyltransferase involved in cell wall biosynthesis
MKISIILTTYNRGRTFLRQAIQSVIDQTYKDWELIILDNYSTDNTDDIVNEFSIHNIKYIKLHNNGVIAKSRNAGIKIAQGEYISLIDSDDFWEVNKLEESYKHLSQNKYDGFCHAENWLFNDEKKMVVKYGPEKKFSFENLLSNGNCLSPSATIIKRDLLNEVGGYSEDEKFITAEDYDLWLKISKKGYKIIFSEAVLGWFRVHSAAESYDIIRNTNAVSEVIKSHIKNSSFDEKYLHKALSNCWRNAGKTCQIRGEYRSSLAMYCKSIKLNIFSFKSWFLIFSLFIPHMIFIFIYNSIKSRKQ